MLQVNAISMKKMSLEVIEKHKLFFVEDVLAYLPIAKQTFYNYRLHEDNDIKTMLWKNKTDIKVSLRNKWYKSDNPALQMGLYKIIASEEEAARLNASRHQIEMSPLTLETSKSREELLTDINRITSILNIQPSLSKEATPKIVIEKSVRAKAKKRKAVKRRVTKQKPKPSGK